MSRVNCVGKTLQFGISCVCKSQARNVAVWLSKRVRVSCPDVEYGPQQQAVLIYLNNQLLTY